MDSHYFSLALVFICLTGNIEELAGQKTGEVRPLAEFSDEEVQTATDFLVEWLGDLQNVIYEDCYDVQLRLSNLDGTGQTGGGTRFNVTFNEDVTLSCIGTGLCKDCVPMTFSRNCRAIVYLDEQSPPVASFKESGDTPLCKDG